MPPGTKRFVGSDAHQLARDGGLEVKLGLDHGVEGITRQLILGIDPVAVVPGWAAILNFRWGTRPGTRSGPKSIF